MTRSVADTNAALKSLGDRWAAGEIDAEAYLAQSYRLISAIEGGMVDDSLASEQRTHPQLPIIEDSKSLPRWLWLVPVLLALGFLVGLAWLLF